MKQKYELEDLVLFKDVFGRKRYGNITAIKFENVTKNSKRKAYYYYINGIFRNEINVIKKLETK